MFQSIAIRNISGNKNFVRKSNFFLTIIVLCTLLIRYNEYLTFREFNTDKARQLQGAYNLLKNKNISFESYDLNTFQAEYKYISDWPPAYSYFTAGISKILKIDLYTSSVILDFIAITVLWMALLWITNLLKFTILQQSLLFFFLSIAPSVLQQFLSADLLGVALYLVACGFCINYAQTAASNKQKNLLFYVIQFFLILIMLFLKFSLIPAALSLSISFLLLAYGTSNSVYIKPGLMLFGLFMLSLVLLFFYNSRIGENSVTLQRITSGNQLHFDNLLLFNPFIASALFYFAPLYLRFNEHIIHGIAMTITLAVIVLVAISFIKNIKERNLSYCDSLFISTLVLVSSFLIAISLRFPRETSTDGWTFVKEYRYFAPVILLFFIYAFKRLKLNRKIGYNISALSFLIILSCTSTFVIQAYYKVINNKANSFNNLYGKVFDISNYVINRSDTNTYFLSLTNNALTDTELTSLVAIHGVKVSIRYYNYFPSSAINILFNKAKTIARGKKIIIYYGENKTILKNINPQNRFWIEQNGEGDEFLVIKN